MSSFNSIVCSCQVHALRAFHAHVAVSSRRDLTVLFHHAKQSCIVHGYDAEQAQKRLEELMDFIETNKLDSKEIADVATNVRFW